MPEHLIATPGQTVGPFFHFGLLYEGSDELVPAGSAGATRLHGRVFDGAGDPLRDALIEIRQADAAGVIPVVEGSLRRRGGVFTGWGRAATDPAGRYSFTTLEPGATHEGAAPFFSVVVFARGLLNRLFTRAYLPGASDPLLTSLDGAARQSLLTVREPDGSLRFDIHLQGAQETTFLSFPGQGI